MIIVTMTGSTTKTYNCGQSGVLYQLIQPIGLIKNLVLLATFNLLLVLCSQVTIHLPLIPITGQTFGVLVIAMILGSKRGSVVVAAYLVEGALGLPVFAEGRGGITVLLGPTGGYLLGFLAASYLVGFLAERGWDRRLFSTLAAMILGTSVIFVVGLCWLTTFVPTGQLLELGLLPFLPGALIKITLAALLLPTFWRFFGKKTKY